MTKDSIFLLVKKIFYSDVFDSYRKMLQEKSATDVLIKCIQNQDCTVRAFEHTNFASFITESAAENNNKLNQFLKHLIEKGADPFKCNELIQESSISLANKLNLCGHLVENHCIPPYYENGDCAAAIYANHYIGNVYYHYCQENLADTLQTIYNEFHDKHIL